MLKSEPNDKFSHYRALGDLIHPAMEAGSLMYSA